MLKGLLLICLSGILFVLPFVYGDTEEDVLVIIFISSTNKDVVILDSCWLNTHVIVSYFFDL